jgi:hypothetical protein
VISYRPGGNVSTVAAAMFVKPRLFKIVSREGSAACVGMANSGRSTARAIKTPIANSFAVWIFKGSPSPSATILLRLRTFKGSGTKFY